MFTQLWLFSTYYIQTTFMCSVVNCCIMLVTSYNWFRHWKTGVHPVCKTKWWWYPRIIVNTTFRSIEMYNKIWIAHFRILSDHKNCAMCGTVTVSASTTRCVWRLKVITDMLMRDVDTNWGETWHILNLFNSAGIPIFFPNLNFRPRSDS